MEILIFPAIFFLLIMFPAFFADKALEEKKKEINEKERKIKEAERKAEREIERKAQMAERALDTEDKQKHNYYVDTQFIEYIQGKLDGYNVIYITGYKETICRNGLSVSFIHSVGNEEKRETVFIPAPLAS